MHARARAWQILEQMGHDFAHQRLYLNSVSLHNARRLAAVGVTAGCTLHLRISKNEDESDDDDSDAGGGGGRKAEVGFKGTKLASGGVPPTAAGAPEPASGGGGGARGGGGGGGDAGSARVPGGMSGLVDVDDDRAAPTARGVPAQPGGTAAAAVGAAVHAGGGGAGGGGGAPMGGRAPAPARVAAPSCGAPSDGDASDGAAASAVLNRHRKNSGSSTDIDTNDVDGALDGCC